MSINLQDLKSTFTLDSGPLKAGATAVIAGVGAVVAGIGIAAKATMDWAADLDGLGDVMDGTNKDFAALAFIARKSGVGVDAVTRANILLNKSLLKANGTLDTNGQKLRAYGIQVKDVNGNVKNSVQLTEEIADKYASLSTAQERVNFLTDIYGKSGADMIDFFDTLVAEGGLDAVTKKVEAFGLAIDPARYEQFNRNLEEMKLIGTGLAVQLTEKLMPVLENMTDWLMNKGIPGFIEFKKRLERAFRVGGLKEALKLLDTQVSEWLNEIDWEGYGNQFGDFLEQALTNGSGQADVPKSLESLGRGIRDFFIAAAGEENVDAFKMLFENLDVFVKYQMDAVNNNLVTKAKEGMAQFWTENDTGLKRIQALYDFWKVSNLGIMSVWGIGLNSSADVIMSNLASRLDNRLRDISKSFFNRALGWTTQAKKGLEDGIGGLIAVVEGIVDEINGILRRIRTHFEITFSLGGQTSGVSNSSNLGNPADNPNTEGGRATGGPVLANRAYNVVELNRPEVFRPNTSGRVDPVSNKPIVARLAREDIQELKMAFTEAIAVALG